MATFKNIFNPRAPKDGGFFLAIRELLGCAGSCRFVASIRCPFCLVIVCASGAHEDVAPTREPFFFDVCGGLFLDFLGGGVIVPFWVSF